MSYVKRGMYREAVETFKKAVKVHPNFAEAHYNLGVAYEKIGKYEDAIEACKKVIRITPNYAMAYNHLGVVYTRLRMYWEAVEAHKQAVRINPDYANAYYNLGNTYLRFLGMHREAVEVRIKPDDAEAHYDLGTAYYKLGMYREAIEVLKEAIRIKPELVEAHFGLGLAHLELGDRSSALEEYEILKDLDPQKADELFNLIEEQTVDLTREGYLNLDNTFSLLIETVGFISAKELVEKCNKMGMKEIPSADYKLDSILGYEFIDAMRGHDASYIFHYETNDNVMATFEILEKNSAILQAGIQMNYPEHLSSLFERHYQKLVQLAEAHYGDGLSLKLEDMKGMGLELPEITTTSGIPLKALRDMEVINYGNSKTVCYISKLVFYDRCSLVIRVGNKKIVDLLFPRP
jgi:tetratricopeptide (TPR) repeat protein